MTDMWRLTLGLPKDIEDQVIELRKTDMYCRSSMSEILRDLIRSGLNETAQETPSDQTT